MKVLFLNHKQNQCGVYQYGKRISEILDKDNRYQLIYSEVESNYEFQKELEIYNPDVILYNWHLSTMNWLNNNITNSLKTKKQLFFFHELHMPNFNCSDGIITLDLSEDEKNKKFSIPRPLYNFGGEKIKNEKITFGSFGFGFTNKGFDKICSLINDNFESATIKLHISSAFFGDRDGRIASEVIDSCRKKINKKNIDLKITNNFLSNHEILNFLNSNDANIFMYDQLQGRGVSSCVDYALSVDTPLILNNSNMFRHILSEKPEISIEKNDINSILNIGIDPVLHFRKKWSNDNMRDKFYKILQKI